MFNPNKNKILFFLFKSNVKTATISISDFIDNIFLAYSNNSLEIGKCGLLTW